MYLEIVTPEAVVFGAEVVSVRVPGMDGEFQMLNHHAAIVSLLVEGEVKIDLASATPKMLKNLPSAFRKEANNVLFYPIKGGVLEMKDNKAIVLADLSLIEGVSLNPLASCWFHEVYTLTLHLSIIKIGSWD